MGAMNRGMNLPQIQRIMHEFEKESATMDMKEEMMSDAVDDVMDDELEEEEEEGDKILRQVLDEIEVDLDQQVRARSLTIASLKPIVTSWTSSWMPPPELPYPLRSQSHDKQLPWAIPVPQGPMLDAAAVARPCRMRTHCRLDWTLSEKAKLDAIPITLSTSSWIDMACVSYVSYTKTGNVPSFDLAELPSNP